MSVLTKAITVDPDVRSGMPVFAESRVPIHSLIEFLATGDSLEHFLDQFPTVPREQAIDALHELLALATAENDARPAR